MSHHILTWGSEHHVSKRPRQSQAIERCFGSYGEVVFISANQNGRVIIFFQGKKIDAATTNSSLESHMAALRYVFMISLAAVP